MSKNDDFKLYLNNNEIYTTSFNGGGATPSPRTWSYALTSANALTAGVTYTITAKIFKSGVETAKATQTIVYSTPLTVNITTPISGGATPVINGTTSIAGATVEVTIDGILQGIVTADSNKNWTLSVERPLSAGNHTIVAKATDALGATATSQSVTYTVSASNLSISIDNGTAVVLNDNEPTIRGRTNAPDGSAVTVTIVGSGVNKTYPATATNGLWRIEVPSQEQLPDGVYNVTATVTSNSVTATAVQSLTIDTSTAVAIASPADGDNNVSVSQRTVSGTAEPLVTVKININNGPIKTFTSGANGTWTYTLDSDWPVGTNHITATAEDTLGNTASAESTFTVKEQKSIASVSNITKNVTNGTSLADAKAALGTSVTVNLTGGGTAEVPITWSADSTPAYNGSVAGTYVFTGTFGTMPANVDNNGHIAAPSGTVIVGTASITSGK